MFNHHSSTHLAPGGRTLLSQSQLTHLYLSDNQLESVGQLAVSHSPLLEVLTLDNNKLQSIDNDMFRNSTRITNLTISGNLLTGRVLIVSCLL